ncbi:CPBP family intramembrane metalloprotease [Flavobacterium alkalisoli]|uniref:CPBP family intramembrane metalloprotease n=1 Tax=Flavobacterium alkalisoli TaxID=2602769 RepID=A0A5B9FSL8_9FLAO|nr:CPBP family intramembrane glutamic endopeptidase [Flavobacterium alkalisoli]QEE50303.1 CPBP family intramembrane metalloprotease [Flavobacterium alkalisoli]
MFIEQAHRKDFNFALYLPIPLVFLVMMVLNYAAIKFLNINTEELLRQEVAKKGANRVFFDLIAPLAVGLILLLLYVKFIHKQTIRSLTTARKKVDWKRIFFAFGIWSAFTMAVTLFDYYSHPDNYVWNFKPVPFAILAALSIVLIPMQTSFEEYLFRGYLMQGIGVQTRSRLAALLITSIIFGLMHIANPEVDKMGYIIMIYYIGTGLFLGIITLMDDGMELALGFHAANNLITALLVTSDWTAFQTHSVLKEVSEPAMGLSVVLPVFIIFPILLFIFSKKYNWHNWKEKLTGKLELPTNDSINQTPSPHE